MNVFTKCVADAEKMYPVHPSVANFFRMMEAVEDIPERKPEWDVRKPYFPWEGRHEIDKAKVYDAEFAELCGEKEIRAEKFRKTHDICKKSKDDTPADRRRNKLYRLRKMYGDVWEDGREWYYENGKTGSKKSTEKDAEIFRNLRERSMENDARMDYITETVERKVGYNTVQRIMHNADKRMREIRAEASARHDNDGAIVETYDDSYVVRCGDGGFQFFYPSEYYDEKATWQFYEYMIGKYGMEYANKYAKGEI